MIKSIRLSVVLAGVLMLVVSSCNNIFERPNQLEQSGKVSVTITIVDSSARTVLPDAVSLEDITNYVLLGAIDGGSEIELASFSNSEKTIELEPGDWNFTLNAYNNNDTLVLQGRSEVSIDSDNNRIGFVLFPLDSDTGAIRITFILPKSAETTGITVIADDETLSDEFSVADDSGAFSYPENKVEFLYSKEVPAGNYLIAFRFFNSNGQWALYSELVVVRNGMTSSKTIDLTDEFVIIPPDTNTEPDPDPETITGDIVIHGVTVPTSGEPLLSTITPTEQYTGIVEWRELGDNTVIPAGTTAAAGTVYVATIHLTAEQGYVFEKGAASFTVDGAESTSTTEVPNQINAVFPKTETVEEPPVTANVVITISLGDFAEWENLLEEKTVTINSETVFSAPEGYRSYQWYVNGELKQEGASSDENPREITVTFDSSGTYEIAVVVTNQAGEKRSGRCRVIVR